MTASETIAVHNAKAEVSRLFVALQEARGRLIRSAVRFKDRKAGLLITRLADTLETAREAASVDLEQIASEI